TTAAANDLMEIARYGDERFGVAQSDAYRDQLKAHFSRLAQQPKLFAAVDDIRAGYRRSVHAVYFRIEGDDVIIVRVLRSQDVNRGLSSLDTS
ncbi:MAG: type II toxin-antitoxin system RelE/ParE family toxin, partial [Gammaproteobacteria bacterium]